MRFAQMHGDDVAEEELGPFGMGLANAAQYFHTHHENLPPLLRR